MQIANKTPSSGDNTFYFYFGDEIPLAKLNIHFEQLLTY